ncbi:GLUG motif-containing protein [Desulfonatronum sp. SC1]|uniref:InlB B-repeat-containing protein n=1 Tax=Desulfonatronum sp. SC1 TaxID=2109626 RepID=UPI000D320A78|nr:GLUG motif-containing protein [Desulfonatronum sp. SC1]PTN32862.1 hypothetical protein C6366_15540 [Desulfonatronum sp. SC1]
MKKFLFLVLTTMLFLTLTGAAMALSSCPGDMTGEGTPGDPPCQVTTPEQLNSIRGGFLGLSYKLMNDIDLDVGPYNVGEGWEPISTFTGNFDGDGHTISGLFINRPGADLLGLFGATEGATIKNLGLTNVAITGQNLVGGLAGSSSDGVTLSNCYSTGTVSGNNGVGGLVGGNIVAVTPGTITSSYSTAAINGNESVGGLVGMNSGAVTNSYATGNVTGTDEVGGLVGLNSAGPVISSYSTGTVTGTTNVGGLVGLLAAALTVTDSFWDTQTSGQTSSAAGTGKTTAQMKSIVTFTNTGTEGLDDPWDFNATWTMDGDTNSGYPYLRGVTPTDFPLVTTQAVDDITHNSATGYGSITYMGASNPEEHGVCWATTENPTTDDDCAGLGAATSTGAFTASLTGLISGTTHYVRAYATNTAGTGYGGNQQFTTDPTYIVTPTAGTGGTVSGSGTYAHGSTVTVSATPDHGYVFVNWTEGSTVVSCDAQYSFRVTGNRTLRANFSPVRSQYTIAGAAKPASYGTVNGSGPYNHGANVTMTVLLSNQGVFLTNWIETWPGLAGYCVVSTDEQFAFTATRKRNLTANVRPKVLPMALMLILDE